MGITPSSHTQSTDAPAMNAAQAAVAAAIAILGSGGARSERHAPSRRIPAQNPTISAKPTIPSSASVSRKSEWASRT